MFRYSPRCKMMIPPFNHGRVMRDGNFVPHPYDRYNLCRSLDFPPGKIMPHEVLCPPSYK